jgi:hypothetical protein
MDFSISSRDAETTSIFISVALMAFSKRIRSFFLVSPIF